MTYRLDSRLARRLISDHQAPSDFWNTDWLREKSHNELQSPYALKYLLSVHQKLPNERLTHLLIEPLTLEERKWNVHSKMDWIIHQNHYYLLLRVDSSSLYSCWLGKKYLPPKVSIQFMSLSWWLHIFPRTKKKINYCSLYSWSWIHAISLDTTEII